jgi:hypothetical protein
LFAFDHMLGFSGIVGTDATTGNPARVVRVIKRARVDAPLPPICVTIASMEGAA